MERRVLTLQLALRNVRRQVGRSLFISGAVALGVAALILAGGFIKDTIVELGDSIIYAQTGHIQVSRDGYREAASFDPEAYLMGEAEDLRSELAQAPGARQVLLRLYTAGLAGNGDSDWPVAIEGVEAEREAELGSYISIAAGRNLGADDPFGVLLGAGVADALAVGPGDWIDIVAPTLDGATNALEFQVVGVFQTFSKDYDAHTLRIPLAAAQELLAADGANVAVVELQQTSSTARAAEDLRAELEPRGYAVARWEQLDPFYAQTVTLYEQQFGFLIAVILLLVVLGVGTAIGMGIHERAGEFGTLRALGTRDAGVARLIVTEAALLGLFGAVAGCVLGNALAAAISAVGIPMPPPPNSDLAYTALILHSLPVSLLAMGVGVVAPVLAALRPALRGGRKPIVEALGQAI